MYPVLNNVYVLVKQYKEPYIYKAFSEEGESYNMNQNMREIVNKTACEILELCNGSNSVSDIVNVMNTRYNEDYNNTKNIISNFLVTAQQKHYIKISEEMGEHKIIVKGGYQTVTPIIAVCELTKKCPLDCLHCLNNSGNKRYYELDTEQWLKTLEKLYDIGVQKVNLTGGEVFARDDFFTILDFCSKHFLAVAINSNGFYIDEECAEKLTKYRHNTIYQISIDGMEKTHNLIRRNNFSFDRAINAIKNLAQNNIAVSAAITCNKYNVDEVEEVTKLVKELGANQINISRTLEEGRAKDENLSDGVPVEKIFDITRHVRQKYADDHFFVIDPDDKKPYVESGRDKVCGAGKVMICVRENGDLSPCLSIQQKLGNMIEDNFADELFLYHKWKAFYELNRPNDEFCEGCENINRCLGCNATALEIGDDLCKWKKQAKEQINEIIALPKYYNT